MDTISKLKPNVTTYSQKCSPRLVHNCGLSRKKLHEIVSFAALIEHVCRENDANIVIDVGAGLVSIAFKYGKKIF